MRMETGTSQDHLTKRPIVQSNLYTATFNTKDLDTAAAMRRAAVEAPKITWTNGRPPDIVVAHCIMGQCVEQHLIQNCGYTNNPNDFMDVYNTIMAEIETKVSTTEQGIRDAIGKLEYLRWTKGYHIADIVQTYLCDNFSGTRWKEPGFITDEWDANFTFYRQYLANDETKLYENYVLPRGFVL